MSDALDRFGAESVRHRTHDQGRRGQRPDRDRECVELTNTPDRVVHSALEMRAKIHPCVEMGYLLGVTVERKRGSLAELADSTLPFLAPARVVILDAAIIDIAFVILAVFSTLRMRLLSCLTLGILLCP